MEEKEKMKVGQERQAKYYNKSARDLKPLKEGDVIRMKPYKKGDKSWKKGVVEKACGTRSYEVSTESGVFRRNRVDLRKSMEAPAPRLELELENESENVESRNTSTPIPEPVTSPAPRSPSVNTSHNQTELRRSSRTTKGKMPERFKDFLTGSNVARISAYLV